MGRHFLYKIACVSLAAMLLVGIAPAMVLAAEEELSEPVGEIVAVAEAEPVAGTLPAPAAPTPAEEEPPAPAEAAPAAEPAPAETAPEAEEAPAEEAEAAEPAAELAEADAEPEAGAEPEEDAGQIGETEEPVIEAAPAEELSASEDAASAELAADPDADPEDLDAEPEDPDAAPADPDAEPEDPDAEESAVILRVYERTGEPAETEDEPEALAEYELAALEALLATSEVGYSYVWENEEGEGVFVVTEYVDLLALLKEAGIELTDGDRLTIASADDEAENGEKTTELTMTYLAEHRYFVEEDPDTESVTVTEVPAVLTIEKLEGEDGELIGLRLLFGTKEDGSDNAPERFIGEVAALTVTHCEHQWGDGVVTTEATAAENGVRTYICSACGAEKTEAIPATGPGDSDPGGTGDSEGPGSGGSSSSGSSSRSSSGSSSSNSRSRPADVSNPNTSRYVTTRTGSSSGRGPESTETDEEEKVVEASGEPSEELEEKVEELPAAEEEALVEDEPAEEEEPAGENAVLTAAEASDEQGGGHASVWIAVGCVAAAGVGGGAFLAVKKRKT